MRRAPGAHGELTPVASSEVHGRGFLVEGVSGDTQKDPAVSSELHYCVWGRFK